MSAERLRFVSFANLPLLISLSFVMISNFPSLLEILSKYYRIFLSGGARENARPLLYQHYKPAPSESKYAISDNIRAFTR
jgi:hypothetical protein